MNVGSPPRTSFIGMAFEHPFNMKTGKRNTMKLEETTTYDPNQLLDALIGKLELKNDAALSRALNVAPPLISKIRHHKIAVGATLMISMHEASGFSIKELRVLMGDRRDRFSRSSTQSVL
jgi:hypothetical protein